MVQTELVLLHAGVSTGSVLVVSGSAEFYWVCDDVFSALCSLFSVAVAAAAVCKAKESGEAGASAAGRRHQRQHLLLR